MTEEKARLEALPFSEDELAVRFVDKYGARVALYREMVSLVLPQQGADDVEEDDTLRAMDMAREICRGRGEGVQQAKRQKALSSARTIYAPCSSRAPIGRLPHRRPMGRRRVAAQHTSRGNSP